MEKVKARPVYVAVEIINAGYNFERLRTRPAEREHITSGEAWERTMKKVNPYCHELSSTGGSCAKSCPACLWAEHFEATGDSRRNPITDRPDLTAE
jgi:hypothetical protein